MPYDRKYRTTAKGRRTRGPAMARRRAAPKTTKALNNVEKKQVATIAKRVVKSTAESKYFECNALGNNTRDSMYQASATNNRMWVKAYCLDNTSSSVNDLPDYGYANGIPFPFDTLQMSKCQQTGEQAREGSYVTPSLCQTEWLLRRDALPQNDLNNKTETPGSYMVRMCRVVPRQRSGMNSNRGDVPNPELDLFVDEKGNAIGVKTGDFNAEMMTLYRINTRKYKVILDKFCNVYPAVTSALIASGAGGNPGDVNAPMHLHSVPAPIKFKHDIGSKLYYEDGDDRPSAGLKQEYILFHAYYPTMVDSVLAPEPDQLKITCKSVSTFKDL